MPSRISRHLRRGTQNNNIAEIFSACRTVAVQNAVYALREFRLFGWQMYIAHIQVGSSLLLYTYRYIGL